eukprot:17067-Prorocentrum_minimum.AAC.1
MAQLKRQQKREEAEEGGGGGGMGYSVQHNAGRTQHVTMEFNPFDNQVGTINKQLPTGSQRDL